MKHLSNFTLFHLTLFFVLFVTFASVVVAWSGPSATAPGSNVPAPINVGTASQVKDGALGVSSLAVYGNQYTQGDLGVGVEVPSYKLDVNGSVRATSFLYSSDADLKDDVHNIHDGLGIIKQLRGVTFTWKESGVPSVGLIAQEVEGVLPNLVVTDASTGLRSVKYGNLVAPLIEAIKQQQQQIRNLEIRIQKLESTR